MLAYMLALCYNIHVRRKGMNKKFKKSKIDWTSLIIQSILDLAVGLILLIIEKLT